MFAQKLPLEWIRGQVSAGLVVHDGDGGTLSSDEPDSPRTSDEPEAPEAHPSDAAEETNVPGAATTTSTSTFEELPGGGYRMTRRTVTTRRTVVDDRVEEDVEELLPASAYRAPSVPGHPPAVG